MNLTADMKYAALSWLRYAKNADLVCTEVGTHNLKDVCGVWIGNDGLPTSMAEIEIKVSVSDLKHDFEGKKYKYANYEKGEKCPNYLYYLVPLVMVPIAVPYLNGKNKKYGVLSYDAQRVTSDDPFLAQMAIKSHYKCTKLTNDKPHPSVITQMSRRVVTEYMTQKSVIRGWRR